jgi:PilZ domain
MVLERRREERLLTLKTGKIHVPGGAADIDCAIFDVSRTGACILRPKGADLPNPFDLAIDPDGLHHACKLAWKSGYKIGVRFETAAAT